MSLIEMFLMTTVPARAVSWMSSKRAFHAGNRLARPQNCLPAAYYRGGTSRAIMFTETDLPVDKTAWPAIFRGVLGSPDPNGRQLDGLGGGVSSLSKICIVGPSKHPEADVDYTFVAVGVRDSEVDFSSNCGNMTSAVGPYALDTGIVSIPDSANAIVKIHNTNTGKIIHARFPAEDGKAVADGNFAIDGVAGTASMIQLAFMNPGLVCSFHDTLNVCV